MRRTMLTRPLLVIAGALLLIVGSLAPFSTPAAYATGDTVDELHYSYGNDATSVVFDWHGAEQYLYYGPDTGYGQQAVAGDPPYTPVDEAGPFREVTIGGLQPGTTYHYKIGVNGPDHTFSTEPTGDYTSVDVGDTMSSSCVNQDSADYMPGMQALIAAQDPDFVTHGGDISTANQCGAQAIHQFYTDIEAWSHDAAFQVALGNHEYGLATTSPPAPAGTPNDSLVNYKGRDRISNPQTTPNDTSSTTKHPGCGNENGTVTATNTCPGDDWGYFTAGHVLYIEYPEPDTGAYQPSMSAWQTAADALMAQAQADPNIDFVITEGHRTAFTDSTTGAVPVTHDALVALAAKYSPAPGNTYGLDGKYVVNLQHDAHDFEAFTPNPSDDKHGLTYVTDAAGGQGFTEWVSSLDPDSAFRMRHFGVLVTRYDASAHTLDLRFVCGPDWPGHIKDVCADGSSPWSTQITRPGSTPPAPVIATGLSTGSSSLQVGQSLTYTASVQNTAGGSTASGTSLSVTVPANMSIVSAAGATVTGNTASWAIGYLAGGTAATTEPLVAQLNSGNAGDTLTTAAAVTTGDSSCADSGSSCAATSVVTVAAPPPTGCTAPPAGWTENSGNVSLETGSANGWGPYNSASTVTAYQVPGGSFDGSWALKTAPTSGATAGANNGTNLSKPVWVSSSVAGRSYSGSVMVRASAAGMPVKLSLLEFTPGTGGTQVGTTNTVSIALNDTAWHLLKSTTAYVAQHSGDVIRYSLYDTAFTGTGQYFLADCLSLTSH